MGSTASPQQEHSISKSGDAPRYCLVFSMKIPHSLYKTSLDVQAGLVIPLLLAASTLNSHAALSEIIKKGMKIIMKHLETSALLGAQETMPWS